MTTTTDRTGAGPVRDVPADPDAARRTELAAFLRSRRERISPEQVDLPTFGRRRTPGLRREEVATRAGVGVTWYTWLEQGRRINASPQVLDAISRALLLDAHERSHLFILAGSPLGQADAESHALHPAVQVILDQLQPVPALVTNARKDLLAFNDMFDRMIGGLSSVPWEDRNVLWLAFTDPGWRRRLLDWDQSTARMVAQFRSSMAEHLGDPAWRCLVSRLNGASPEFRALWDRHDVASSNTRTKRIEHPEVGLLCLDYTYLWLGPNDGNKLVTYTPHDDESLARLNQLYDRVRAAA